MEIKAERAPNARTIMAILFAANLLNIYDRTLPGVINELIREQFGLNDLQIGLITASFTLVYAAAGIPLARLADAGSRKIILAVGLATWSIFTGLNGLAWSFGSYLVARMAVGIGEACCSPVAASLIGDLYPSSKRSRASGFYWLGFPAGMLLAFTTAGMIVRIAGTWRATFFVAMIPGLIVAWCAVLIREPARGRSESSAAAQLPFKDPIRRVLRIRSIWWITLAGITSNFSGYAAGSFLVPLLQRYYGLGLGEAAKIGGLILGLTGLIGFTAGGWIVDKIHQRSERGRLVFGAIAMVLASAATLYALSAGPGKIAIFTLAFSIGWLLQYQFLVCIFPAIQDVVEPRLRAVAVAVFFASVYIFGAAFGPAIVGFVSDRAARSAMIAAHVSRMSPPFKAAGLHQAMYLIPVMLLATGFALFFASRTFSTDANAMRRRLSDPSPDKSVTGVGHSLAQSANAPVGTSGL